jgi:hypothetical protein
VNAILDWAVSENEKLSKEDARLVVNTEDNDIDGELKAEVETKPGTLDDAAGMLDETANVPDETWNIELDKVIDVVAELESSPLELDARFDKLLAAGFELDNSLKDGNAMELDRTGIEEAKVTVLVI